MSKAWVVSANMPRVEKNPKMTKQDSKKEKKRVEEKPIGRYFPNEDFSTHQQFIQQMEQIQSDNKHIWCLPDIKVHRNITKNRQMRVKLEHWPNLKKIDIQNLSH